MADRPDKMPEWASDVSSDIVEPPEGKKQQGWVQGEKPPAGFFNWWMSLVAAWLGWFADRIRDDGGEGVTVRGIQSKTTANSAVSHGGVFQGFGNGSGVDATGGLNGGVGVSAMGLGGRPGVEAETIGGDAFGVVGFGGDAGGGVSGTSRGSGPGVYGKSEDSGHGVVGEGGEDGDGVVGYAGPVGEGTPVGVRGIGGIGVLGLGEGTTGAGEGVAGIGEDNRNGVRGRARGSGNGVVAESSGTGAPLRIVPRDTAPTELFKGIIYFDNSSNKLRYYNGSTWVDLG